MGTKLGLAALLAVAAAFPARGADTSTDEAAIRQAMTEAIDGFNRHDAAAVARSFTPDAELVTARGDVMKGAAAIEGGLAGGFASRNKNASLKNLELRVRFLRPDVALVHATNEMTGVVGPDGRPLPPQRERSLRVFVKEAGAWRVSAVQVTLAPAP